MRFNYLAMSIIMCGVSAHAADNNPPYIIPVNADGTVTKVGDDYPDKMQMTAGDDGYYLRNVEIDYGFIFYAQSASGSSWTNYTLTSWAVPMLFTLPNPLAISMSMADYIRVDTKGEYDISFYERNYTGQGYQLFVITPSSAPDEKILPPNIFLVDKKGDVTEIEGQDGVYTASVTLPSEFVVSYEKKNNIPVFIYGPQNVSDTKLTDKAKVPLDYGMNTTAYFTYSDGDKLKAGETAIVSINLNEGDESIMVTTGTPTGIGMTEADDVTVAVSGGEIVTDRDVYKEVYSVSGARLYGGRDMRVGPYPAGVYIVKAGDVVRKVSVR